MNWELYELKLRSSSYCSIHHMRRQVSAAIATPVAAAHQYVQTQASVHSDETGLPQCHRDGSNPNQRKGWLWVLCSPLVRVFCLSLHRCPQAAKDLIGQGFTGIVHSDRYSGYALPIGVNETSAFAKTVRTLRQILKIDALVKVASGFLKSG